MNERKCDWCHVAITAGTNAQTVTFQIDGEIGGTTKFDACDDCARKMWPELAWYGGRAGARKTRG